MRKEKLLQVPNFEHLFQWMQVRAHGHNLLGSLHPFLWGCFLIWTHLSHSLFCLHCSSVKGPTFFHLDFFLFLIYTYLNSLIYSSLIFDCWVHVQNWGNDIFTDHIQQPISMYLWALILVFPCPLWVKFKENGMGTE